MLQTLVKELELRKDALRNQSIETIYFGGGTPSLLNNKTLLLLIETIYKNYRVIGKPEITLEANPDDLTEEKIIELANSPINRLSIGVQSFFEEDLKHMNRAHNASEAKACLTNATRYFDNITIDLIYGIPNMTLEKWNENLKTAFNFGINHISSYALTVEPGTALEHFIEKGKYPPVNEALALEHFNHLVKKTEAAGFIHYEISNFGKPNYFSKHNTSYWKGKSYLGIGPSAHSFNSDHRSWNVSNNIKYIKAIKNNELPLTLEKLSQKDQFNEYIMTGLRTIWGVSLEHVKTNFGEQCLKHLQSSSKKYIAEGLLAVTGKTKTPDNSKLVATAKGKFLVDGIAAELFMI